MPRDPLTRKKRVRRRDWKRFARNHSRYIALCRLADLYGSGQYPSLRAAILAAVGLTSHGCERTLYRAVKAIDIAEIEQLLQGWRDTGMATDREWRQHLTMLEMRRVLEH